MPSNYYSDISILYMSYFLKVRIVLLYPFLLNLYYKHAHIHRI
nr:MAG TPA: hypothetical protein [Caudoviricetes sp.]